MLGAHCLHGRILLGPEQERSTLFDYHPSVPVAVWAVSKHEETRASLDSVP